MATKTPRPIPEAATQPEQGQLRLVVEEVDSSERRTDVSPWRLDDETREIGRQGLARARAILNASRPAHFEPAA